MMKSTSSTTVKVIYFFTVDELRTIQSLEKKRHLRWYHNAASYFIFLGSPFICFTVALWYFGTSRVDAAIACGIAGYIAPFLYWVLGRSMQPVLSPIKKESEPEKFHYFQCTLMENGILIESDFFAGLHYWHAVEEILSEEGFIRMKISGATKTSLNVPIRCFSNIAEANEFLNKAKRLWEQDRPNKEKSLESQKDVEKNAEESQSGSRVLH